MKEGLQKHVTLLFVGKTLVVHDWLQSVGNHTGGRPGHINIFPRFLAARFLRSRHRGEAYWPHAH